MGQADIRAYWGPGHSFNISIPLSGTEQTNNRAERVTAINVLELDLRNVEVRTDSAYVINGTRNLSLWRRRNFWTNRRAIKNADLWKRLDAILRKRRKDSWKMLKVKGHASARDVQLGHVALEDKLGNDRADALAVAGALCRSHDWKARSKFRQEIIVTAAVQKMMVDIVVERERLRKQTEVAPSGSGPSTSSSDTSTTSSSSESSTHSTRSRPRRRARRARGRSSPSAAE